MSNIAPGLAPLAVPISSLKPDPRNARLHSARNIDTIKRSLEAYGQRKPIVVRKQTMTVEAGNGLLQAAKALGWTEIAAVIVEDDDASATGYSIMDNQSALLAEWDLPVLKDLLQELDTGAFDMDLTGFDLKEIEDLMTAFPGQESDAEPQIDKAEELREKWGVESGQLWQIGKHRLLSGDCTRAEDVQQLLQGEKPHLCVTDPPYGVNYDPSWCNKAAAEGKLAYAGRRIGVVENDDRADWSAAWDLFPGDVVYSWHPAGAPSLIHAAALQASGFVLRTQIIWAKSNFPIGRGDYPVRHEPCWYAVRKGKAAHRTDDRTQTTLWESNLDKNVSGGHSTQKPLECMARPIRNHECDSVYEPFLGSGTMMVACQNLGRTCYAIEISPGYVAVALQRMADAFPGISIHKLDNVSINNT